MLGTKKKRYPRAQRKQQILALLSVWSPEKELTMTSIAFWLNMRPSSHLTEILFDMWGDHLLDAREVAHRPNRNKIMWTLSNEGEIASSEAVSAWRKTWGS